MTEDDCPRISDRFPAIKIKLKRQTLVTINPFRSLSYW